MERLIRTLGDQLARSSRRSFLGRVSRAALAFGGGLAVLTTTGSNNVAYAGDGSCPCHQAGMWCDVGGYPCPSDMNTNNGCPGGTTAYYSWWCCMNNVKRKCVDCNIISGETCSCWYPTTIAC